MQNEANSLLTDRRAIAFIALFVGALFSINIATGTYPVDPFWVELAIMHGPMSAFKRACIETGWFPLWVPNIMLGYIAIPHSHFYFFYPPSWILYMKNFMGAMAIFNVFHLLLVGATSYRLFRKIGATIEGAFLAAIPLTIGGYTLANMGFIPVMATFSWTPLAIHLCIETMERRNFRSSIMLAGVTTLQLFAGDFEMIFYQWMFVSIAFLFLVRTQDRVTWGGAFLILVSVAVGSLIAMVQILPMFELFGSTDRVAGWSLLSQSGELGKGLLEYTQWLARIALPIPAVAHFYNLGFVAVAFAAYYFSRDKSKTKKLLLVMFAILFVSSVLYYSPMQRLFSKLPLLRGFRFPTRVFFMAELVLCIAAALGLGRFFERIERDKAPGRWIIWSLLAYSIVSLAFAVINNKPFVAAGITCAIAIATAVFFIRKPLSRKAALAIFVLVTIADVLVFGMQHVPRKPANAMTPYPEALDFIKEMKSGPQRYARSVTYSDKLDGRFISGQEFELDTYTPALVSSLYPKRTSRYFDLMVPESFDYDPKTDALKLVRPFYFWFVVHDFLAKAREKWFELAGIRYILSNKDLVYLDHEPEADRHYKKIRDGAIKIYENDHAFPRAFVVGRTESAPNYIAAYERLKATDELNLRALALIESKSPLPTTEGHPATGEATIAFYGSNRVDVRTSSSNEGWLILTDTYFVGWKAFVNGVESRLYPADGPFRAVRIPAGVATVSFQYRIVAFRIGIWFSIIALMCWAFMYAAKARRD